MLEWFYETPSGLLFAAISAVVLYVILVFLARLVGLRSFSKMASVDFPITIAMGSLLAGVIISKDPPLLQGATALVALFALQWVVSWLRLHVKPIRSITTNQPVLLMVGSTVLEDNLKQTMITHDDLRSKLREANVLNTDQIRAVVLETTGDIAVLHSDREDEPMDLDLLSDVDGYERLRGQPHVREGEGGL